MKKQLIISTLSILILGSCSKGYFDINQNPNSSTNASPELVLSNALTVTVAPQCTGILFLSAWMGYLGQSGSYATGVGDIASYKQTNSFGNAIWVTRYRNLEDYDYIEKSATAQKKYFYAAAAKIMKAFVFQQLVDMFNNLPYTQAFQGTGNITPKYDDAQTVYNAITTQIDSAVILLNRPDALSTGTNQGSSGDVMFNGSNANWIKFANTLKLRILMRQSQVSSNAAFIQAELAKISGGFLTADAAVNPGYANNSGQQSPIWGFFVTLTGVPTSGGAADFWKGSQFALTWMQNHNDPRYTFIYAPGGTGKYIGSVLGGNGNPTGTDGATIGPGILKGVNQPAVLISAAESYFLQAEANLRGWIGSTGDAQGNFNSGVQASFTYLGAGDATAYTSQSDKFTNYGAATNFNDQLACIIKQKWVANDMVTPFETWCDYRRLHLPADVPLSVSPFLDQLPASVPIRILYPSSEYTTNAANVNTQGNVNYHTSPVFWNK